MFDYRAQRYVRFAADGTFLETRPRRLQGVVYPWPGVVEDGGVILDWGLDRQQIDHDESMTTVSIVESGGVKDVGPDTVMRIDHVHPVIPRNTRPRIPHGPRLKVSFNAPERIAWLATSTEYVIYRVTAAGDTTLAFSLDSPPAELGRAARVSAASRSPTIRLDEVPTARPIIGRLFSDDHYVLVVPQLQAGILGHSLDIFTREGRFVGRIESPVPLYSPDTIHGPTISDGLLHVPWADEAGVERVSRLRIDGWIPVSSDTH